MELLNTNQIRKWDQFTMLHEPIASLDLMERAATRCVEWLIKHKLQQYSFKIFCGKGNNGGDGLAIGRQLISQGNKVELYLLEFGKPGTDNFQANLQRLHEVTSAIHFIQMPENLPELTEEDVVIDALFGSGLNKPLEGLAAHVVEHINSSKALVIAIDVPSGLFIDRSSKGCVVVKADYTLTFQTLKLPFLIAENAPYFGFIHILDIGLHPKFLEKETTAAHLVDPPLIKSIYKPKKRFSHKGTFGHALLVGGSFGKMGAIVLATEACLRAGAGLTTAFIPSCGYFVMQSVVPEAMVQVDPSELFISLVPSDRERFTAIGIGPGLGTEAPTQKVVCELVSSLKNPIVVDADGLNCLAKNPAFLEQLPPNSILTPHPKEFERLFGNCANDFDRIETARQKARQLQVILVLKGHHTVIATPSGQLYFNSTGNAGMAKGGSGDVLTGILTALLSQGYDSVHAAILGVYIHGLAGDLAARDVSTEAMIARDIVRHLGPAFLQISHLP